MKRLRRKINNEGGIFYRTGDTPQQIAGIYGNIGSSVSTQNIVIRHLITVDKKKEKRN